MPNYLKHYENLCLSRKKLNRVKSKDTYYEQHHILPKSLGGSNDKSNIVLLTAKEHYIAHLLLYKHYKSIGGKEFRSMAFALVSMSANNKKFKRKILSSRQYANIKEAAILSRKGIKISNTVNYKKPKSKKHIESIRNARLNSEPRSIETRLKMSKSKIGISPKQNRIKSICPHCKKEGQMIAMKRWHFQNCKNKEVNNAQLA